MMKHFLLTAMVITTLIACENKESDTATSCAPSKNPMADYAWLGNLKASMQNCSCERSIIQGTYQKQTVYYIAITDPLCNSISIPTLFNCNGDTVRKFSDADYTDFSDLVRMDTILYRCKN